MPVLNETYKMRPRHTWYSKILRKLFKFRRNKLLPSRIIPDSEIVESVNREKQLIIQVVNGGLGDHLVYSALPELLWKQKGVKTLISTKSIYRNDEIWQYVWEKNPYVTFTDDFGWCIRKPVGNHSDFKTENDYLNSLFGLQGDDCPKLYYDTIALSELRGCTVVDASFGPSGKANGYYEGEFHDKYIAYLKELVSEFVLLTYSNFPKLNPLQKRIVDEFSPRLYEVDSLLTLSSVLVSAKQRYLMYSGSASLSAALGVSSVILCNRRACEFFLYSKNEYIQLTASKYEVSNE